MCIHHLSMVLVVFLCGYLISNELVVLLVIKL